MRYLFRPSAVNRARQESCPSWLIGRPPDRQELPDSRLNMEYDLLAGYPQISQGGDATGYTPIVLLKPHGYWPLDPQIGKNGRLTSYSRATSHLNGRYDAA